MGQRTYRTAQAANIQTDDLATVADVLSAARASALAVTAVSSEDALTALLPRLNLPTLQTLEFRLLASPSAEYVDFPFPTLLEPKALGIPIGPLVALLAGSRARALANVVLRPTVPNMLASQKRAAGEFREKLVAALPQGHGVDGVCVGLCALRSADRWDDLAKCKCAKASDKHFTDASRRRGRASAARIHAASAVLLHSERDDPARPCALFDLPYELLECVLAYAAQDDVLDHLAVRSVIKQVVDRDKLRCTLAAFARHDAAGVPRSRAFHEWCVNGGL